MAITDFGDLSINGQVTSYEGAVKIEKGTKTRVPNPQVNGEIIHTSDISTNRSKIMVPIRVTADSNDQFDLFFENGDNNTITFRDSNFSKCVLEVIPEREDQGIVEYTFFGNPEV